jgi:hypothetical protein
MDINTPWKRYNQIRNLGYKKQTKQKRQKREKRITDLNVSGFADDLLESGGG